MNICKRREGTRYVRCHVARSITWATWVVRLDTKGMKGLLYALGKPGRADGMKRSEARRDGGDEKRPIGSASSFGWSEHREHAKLTRIP